MSEIIQCEDVSKIPSRAGSYAVLLSLFEDRQLQIGTLGNNFFPAGWYIYFGNALGAGGVFSRVSHHLRISEKPHWHIDWFRKAAVPEVVFFTTSPAGLECAWRKIISERFNVGVLVNGFGASDCRKNCGSHLLFFDCLPDLQQIAKTLLQTLNESENLFQLRVSHSAGEGK